jgi:hypothetical protein
MRRTNHGGMVLLTLALLLPACGKSDKEVTAPAAAGTGAKAASCPERDDNPAPPPTPATLKEALAVIDLSTFPVPDGALYADKSPVASSYVLPRGNAVKAVELYRSTLVPQGWKPAADPKLFEVGKDWAQLIFVKQGFVLYASVGVSSGNGNMNAALFHVGNIDARTLPRPAGAEIVDALPPRIIYRTAVKPDDFKQFMRTEMKKQGWQQYSRRLRRGESLPESGQDKELKFLSHAVKAELSINPAGDKTRVICGVGLVNEHLPILPDARAIELDEDPLSLSYYTATAPEKVVDFYQKELATADWKRREGAGSADNKEGMIAFDAAGREPLRLEYIRDMDAGITTVRLTRWPKDGAKGKD